MSSWSKNHSCARGYNPTLQQGSPAGGGLHPQMEVGEARRDERRAEHEWGSVGEPDNRPQGTTGSTGQTRPQDVCRLSLYIARMDASLHVSCAPVTLNTWCLILATFHASLMNMAMFV